MNMAEIKKTINPNNYLPKRFGLRYNPPSIGNQNSKVVIEYQIPSTGKLYHHKIRLNKLKSDSSIQETIKEIYEKHYLYLDNKKIKPEQIVSIITFKKDFQKN